MYRCLVGVPGFEPGASSLSGTRSNQLSYTPAAAQPGRRLRAHRCASVSAPGRRCPSRKGPLPPPRRGLVEATGLEPATSCLQSRRSPKLSYAPGCLPGPPPPASAPEGRRCTRNNPYATLRVRTGVACLSPARSLVRLIAARRIAARPPSGKPRSLSSRPRRSPPPARAGTVSADFDTP